MSIAESRVFTRDSAIFVLRKILSKFSVFVRCFRRGYTPILNLPRKRIKDKTSYKPPQRPCKKESSDRLNRHCIQVLKRVIKKPPPTYTHTHTHTHTHALISPIFLSEKCQETKQIPSESNVQNGRSLLNSPQNKTPQNEQPRSISKTHIYNIAKEIQRMLGFTVQDSALYSLGQRTATRIFTRLIRIEETRSEDILLLGRIG